MVFSSEKVDCLQLFSAMCKLALSVQNILLKRPVKTFATPAGLPVVILVTLLYLGSYCGK